MPDLVIRRAERRDLAAINDLYNTFVRDTHITFDLEPWDMSARETWFETFSEKGPYQLFVGEVEGAFAGYVGSVVLRPKAAYRPSIETTIYLRPEAQGHGAGRRMLTHLLEALQQEDVHRAYAVIALPNEASIRLHEALGFRLVGTLSEVGRKFDRYWDVAWLERELP